MIDVGDRLICFPNVDSLNIKIVSLGYLSNDGGKEKSTIISLDNAKNR